MFVGQDGVLDGRVIRPWVVSKIENKEGIDNFLDILAESDGIMVARGDLGVEVPFEELLILQKEVSGLRKKERPRASDLGRTNAPPLVHKDVWSLVHTCVW